MKYIHRFMAPIFQRLNGFIQWLVLWIFHPKFIVGMTAIILTPDQTKILLQRHRYWKKGSWGMPSGYMNRNEKINQTLIREIREEINATVSDIQVYALKTGYKLRTNIVLTATIKPQVFKPDGKEVLEAQLFEVTQLPEGILDSHRRLLKDFLKREIPLNTHRSISL